MARPSWRLESLLWHSGYPLTAGIDEAGRGALAGPVVAAVVALPYGEYPFKDSKQLPAARREALAEMVKAVALAYGVGAASAQEVDRLNVLQATHLAVARALQGFGLPVDGLVTDYLRLKHPQPVIAVPKGDSQSFQVAAASILAKVTRDALMQAYDARYPQYGFARHKGYGSATHQDALAKYGPCELHRRSFKPVAQGRLFGDAPPTQPPAKRSV
jgi:ribonuclease HII